jgi:tetratricopeptide (TPR) repeat protein
MNDKQRSPNVIPLRRGPPNDQLADSLQRLADKAIGALTELVATANAQGIELSPAVRRAVAWFDETLPTIEGQPEQSSALAEFAATLDELVTAQTLELDMLRRQFLHALGVATGTAILPVGSRVDTDRATEATNRLDYVLRHPRSVDIAAVNQLHDRTADLRERYDQTLSTSLLPMAGQHLSQVMFLREHAPDGRIQHKLRTVEAQSATLMGQLVWDASQRRDHTTANAYYDQAISAARRTQDVTTEAYAYLRKSFVALYGDRDPRQGRSLARQAALPSRNGASPALAGLALLHVGEACAMLGERRRCEHALGTAESQFSQVQAADPAYSLFSPDQLGRLKGSCYLFLGDPSRAQPILESTARGLHDKKKSRAIVLGNLALAYIRQHDLDAAVTILHQAFDVVELTRGGGALNVLFTAGHELRPCRHEPIVRAVYDRLFALVASA